MNAYDALPDQARIWIYASDRLLSAEEETQIQTRAATFLSNWTSHQVPVDATFDVLHHCFLIFGANEETSDISGCGIDKSVAFVRELGEITGINFFDRMQIEVMLNNRLGLFHKSDMPSLLAGGMIHESTATFNKMISRKKDMEQFVIPLSEAWFYSSVKPETVR